MLFVLQCTWCLEFHDDDFNSRFKCSMNDCKPPSAAGKEVEEILLAFLSTSVTSKEFKLTLYALLADSTTTTVRRRNRQSCNFGPRACLLVFLISKRNLIIVQKMYKFCFHAAPLKKFDSPC